MKKKLFVMTIIFTLCMGAGSYRKWSPPVVSSAVSDIRTQAMLQAFYSSREGTEAATQDAQEDTPPMLQAGRNRRQRLRKIKPFRRAVSGALIALSSLSDNGIDLPRNLAQRAIEGIIAKGAALHGSNGLAFDDDDQLFIASLFGREIAVMSPTTGKIRATLGTSDGVEGPDDLAFGPDGSLYWTSFFTGEVGRISPSNLQSTVAQLPPGVNGITFSDDGRLFVSLFSLQDALYEIDPQKARQPRLIRENIGGLNGMDWGSDGLLYGPLWLHGQVVSIDVDRGTVTTVADGFHLPSAVKFDSKGRLHVLDYQTGEVWRVDIRTGEKKAIAKLTPGLDNLAFDSHDRLFVSNAAEGFIAEILSGGITRMVAGSGGMSLPGAIAVVPRALDSEAVFVADLWSVREFSGLTGRQEDVERHFIGLSDLQPPLTVWADANSLVLSSALANIVQVWDLETRQVVESYSVPGQPLNAIRFQGEIIAAELGTGRVIQVGDGITLASNLTVPAGLAATKDDLWVGDWDTGTVWQIVADGQILPGKVQVATGLNQPEGLAVEDEENLLVVEAGAGRLSRINLETGKVSPLAENLKLGAQAIPGTPPTWVFNGVAVSPSGTIYVTGDIDNVLYRFNPRIRPFQLSN